MDVADSPQRPEREGSFALQGIALAAIGEAIVITDRDGAIIWTNPAFTRLTGYSREEAVGRTPRMLKSGRHSPEFYARLWGTILSGRVWRGRIVNRRKDGTRYPERQVITPVADAGGRITHFVVVKDDVTQRRNARKALRDRGRLFRSLLENAHDIITIIGLDGTIRYGSAAVERVLGYRPEELVGRNALEFIALEDRDRVARLIGGEARIPERNGSLQFRFRHRDGSWRILEGVGKNMVDDPVVAGIIVNARDVTDRARAEEELRRQRESRYQSEKLADMGTLLAGVAHELNNPLAVVVGYATLLRSAVGDGPLGERAEKLVNAAERCNRIIRNFLALARQRPPQREPVRLNQIVLEAVELLAYPLRVDNCEVILDLADDLPALWADPHQLHQVVINLITNAHQAMRDAPLPRRLVMATRAEGEPDRLVLEVRDTGPGILPEIQARMFEPFFTTKPPGQGTGLGLPICQGIVAGHGGRLRVESQAGRGAAVMVELPLATPPAPAVSPPLEDALPVEPGRILVVDDEPDVAQVLVDLLEGEGHVVQTATDGQAALRALEKGSFDLVLSDVRMPRMDGPALYEEIGRRAPSLLRRLVFLTGDTLSARTREFLDGTGAPSLSKPLDVVEVKRVVAVGLRQAEEQPVRAS